MSGIIRCFEKFRKIPRKISTVEPSLHEVADKKIRYFTKKVLYHGYFPEVLRKFSEQISYRTPMGDCFYNLPDKLA